MSVPVRSIQGQGPLPAGRPGLPASSPAAADPSDSVVLAGGRLSGEPIRPVLLRERSKPGLAREVAASPIRPAVRPPVPTVLAVLDEPGAVRTEPRPDMAPLLHAGTVVALGVLALVPVPGLVQAVQGAELQEAPQLVKVAEASIPASTGVPAVAAAQAQVPAPPAAPVLPSPAPDPAQVPEAPTRPAAPVAAQEVPAKPAATAAAPEATKTAKPQAALALPGTSATLDQEVTYRVPWVVKERTFGHNREGGHLFDRSGNWADTGTAVTADQVAAMPLSQREALAARAGVKVEALALGEESRVILEPAVGEVGPGQVVDQGRSQVGEPKGGVRNFGHDPVHGRLFKGNTWADDGSLVSADQAAAMPKAQRNSLALSAGVKVEALRLGDPSRVLVEPAAAGATPFDEIAARNPGRIVTVDGFRMRADTAVAFSRLRGLIEAKWPGRSVAITSTMGGRHTDPAHRQGRAVDFAVSPLTNKESRELEKLCWQVGLRPYNEYIHRSAFWTGPHMHVNLVVE